MVQIGYKKHVICVLAQRKSRRGKTHKNRDLHHFPHTIFAAIGVGAAAESRMKQRFFWLFGDNRRKLL